MSPIALVVLCGDPLFQLWPEFTGAIVDPVVGAGTVAILRIGITGDRPTAISSLCSSATATIGPVQAVDRHAVRLVQASKILRRVSTDKIR
jgi:hypothetical protein